jgi:uncharacterized membrane protein
MITKYEKGGKQMLRNFNREYAEQLTFGERVADKLTEFGGSWTFIGLFFLVLIGWMTVNIYALGIRHFDEYPFILLNLVLSCLAALQAPIIMMSQNRQNDKDRMQAEHDYEIDRKAELEIQDMQKDLAVLQRDVLMIKMMVAKLLDNQDKGNLIRSKLPPEE